MPCLKKWIDEENIPEYLGGKSKGTLIDDVGPWHSEELVREVEMERLGGQGAAEGDVSARSGRHDDWTPMRQSSTLSNATGACLSSCNTLGGEVGARLGAWQE